jgi:hypothetical protein
MRIEEDGGRRGALESRVESGTCPPGDRGDQGDQGDQGYMRKRELEKDENGNENGRMRRV